MSLRRLPIRWRLTAWYAALLATAMAVFGIATYFGLRYSLYDTFKEQVGNQSALALSAIRFENGHPALDDATVTSLDNDEHFVRLYAADGSLLLDRTAKAGTIPNDPAAVTAALAGRTQQANARISDQTFAITTAPIFDGDTIVGALQTGLSRGDNDEILRMLWVALVISAPLVLALAAVGGYLLAGRALRPVATITSQAARIGAADLHARLNLDLPDDELGRLAQTFDAMLARIEDAFERQRRFTGDAAHELRTPLSLMRSQVDLALARPRTIAQHREALHELDADLERLTRLVGTLLTLARSDTGHLTLDLTRFDIAETIGVILDQYAPVASEAGISLSADTASTPVEGDHDLLVQVLVNLVDNAFAHTLTGGAITIGSRAQSDGAHLWVADTGEGIPSNLQERVFDRFFRIDEGRSRARGGVGLGLSICRAIVAAHGGAIDLASQPGHGTRIEFTLPLRPQPQPPKSTLIQEQSTPILPAVQRASERL